MKIRLIYNGIGIAGLSSDRLIGDREGTWISHGLASIGASVKQVGYDVDLTDMRQLKSYQDLPLNADVYGISISSVDYWYALRTILYLKNHNKECVIIVGGIHPTIHPEKYDFSAINTVVKGEGEITFVKLLEMIDKGLPLPKYIQGEKPDLDKIPFVDRELFQYYRELSCKFVGDQQIPAITMLAGRGCAYQCTYCQPAENAVFGKPYRMRSVDNVLEEIQMLKKKYFVKSITFWDDTFTFNKKWISEFCSKYEGMDLVACSRADIICDNQSMIKNLAKVGLKWLIIGFETGSQRLLDFIQKGTTIEENIVAAEICHKNGIKVFGTYMYGLPTETKEESKMTFDMIERINPEHKSPFWFNPIPGTKIYDYCEKNDLLLSVESIARTGIRNPTLKGIDYNYINTLVV